MQSTRAWTWVTLWLMVSGLAVAACDVPPSTTGLPPTESPAAWNSRGVSVARFDSLHPEAQMRRLAKQIPGFGGWFFDSEGDLNVWVTDPEAHASLARSIAETASRELPPGRKTPYAIRIRRGQYGFEQLSAWRDRLEASADEIPDIQ